MAPRTGGLGAGVGAPADDADLVVLLHVAPSHKQRAAAVAAAEYADGLAAPCRCGGRIPSSLQSSQGQQRAAAQAGTQVATSKQSFPQAWHGILLTCSTDHGVGGKIVVHKVRHVLLVPELALTLQRLALLQAQQRLVELRGARGDGRCTRIGQRLGTKENLPIQGCPARAAQPGLTIWSGTSFQVSGPAATVLPQPTTVTIEPTGAGKAGLSARGKWQVSRAVHNAVTSMCGRLPPMHSTSRQVPGAPGAAVWAPLTCGTDQFHCCHGAGLSQEQQSGIVVGMVLRCIFSSRGTVRASILQADEWAAELGRPWASKHSLLQFGKHSKQTAGSPW